MDNKEILEKALERAVKNGYAKEQIDSFWIVLSRHTFDSEMRSILIKALLFDHDFCRAFFGEDMYYDDAGYDMIRWQYYLQKMVLEEEPLKYIERFLGEK